MLFLNIDKEIFCLFWIYTDAIQLNFSQKCYLGPTLLILIRFHIDPFLFSSL